MTHAVFTIKADSGYDDVPEEKYHFPAQYISRVRQAIGDLIVYYEPRRGDGRLSYIAVARVDQVDPDPRNDDHYYARISEYLNFDQTVPFRGEGGLFESSLRGQGQAGLSGEFRNAVRLLPQHEFEAIIAAGFSTAQEQSPFLGAAQLDEEPAEFRRPIVEQVVRRPFREAAFTRQVKTAYSNRCALTGLDMPKRRRSLRSRCSPYQAGRRWPQWAGLDPKRTCSIENRSLDVRSRSPVD